MSVTVSPLSGVVLDILAIVCIVALWVIFNKAGEKGWKAIIPFYNGYVFCKLFWKKQIFWVILILTVLTTTFTSVVIVSHVDDVMDITSTAANEFGISEEDLVNGNLNMTEEEINQAAQNALDKMVSDIENDVDNPLFNSFVNAFKNITAVDIILMLLTSIILIVLFVMGIMLYYKLSKSFGHGAGYTLGLIFLSPIFLLILAFGKSQYQKLEA